MKSKSKPKQQGFTLIELLVVVAIIGVLATVVLSNLSAARQRAQDTKRIALANQIKSAMELYYLDNNEYPLRPQFYNEAVGGAWDRSNQDLDNDGIYFLDPLIEGGYLSNPDLKTLVLNNGSEAFRYFNFYANDAANYGCSPAKAFYIVEVALEGGPHSSNPGFPSCTGRNFASEGDYVFGEYF